MKITNLSKTVIVTDRRLTVWFNLWYQLTKYNECSINELVQHIHHSLLRDQQIPLGVRWCAMNPSNVCNWIIMCSLILGSNWYRFNASEGYDTWHCHFCDVRLDWLMIMQYVAVLHWCWLATGNILHYHMMHIFFLYIKVNIFSNLAYCMAIFKRNAIWSILLHILPSA